jgi:hypothetical protein
MRLPISGVVQNPILGMDFGVIEEAKRMDQVDL